MPRLRRLEIYPPVELYTRLDALAKRHQGPKAKVSEWVVTILSQVALQMEHALNKQDQAGKMVILPGTPRVSVGPLVVG